MLLNLPASRPVLWWLYTAACLSFLTTLALPYVGEEAVYTITSLEMGLSGDFFVTTLYGNNYGRPPLLNWLIIAFANVLGWDHVLLASRIVTAGATVATGLVLAWLVSHLTRNDTFAAFSAVVLLTSDALFYRGWLAYSDSLFTLCVFGAIACLWVCVHERRQALVWLAVAALTCGFLAKVQTAYVFYGVAALALSCNREYRRELLHPNSIAAHLVAAIAFVAWHVLLTRGAQTSSTLVDILLKAQTVALGAHAAQVAWFPLETVLRFLPASAVALYYWWRTRRAGAETWAEAPVAGFVLAALVWMLAVNYLPYWLGPKSHIRYIMPLYPLIALFVAHVIWRAGKRPVAVAVQWFAAAIALKYVVGLWAFPAYQHSFRGDYSQVAADIDSLTRGFPLYATDTTATGLSVAAHINTRRYPAKPLQWPPAQWDSGFVIAYTQDPALGQVLDKYRLGRNDLYLLCRGTACGKARQ